MSHKHPKIYLGHSESFEDKIKYKVYEHVKYNERKGKKLVHISMFYILAEVLYANDGTFISADLYKHSLTRPKGRDLVKECLTSNNMSIGTDFYVVLNSGKISLSDYLEARDKYSGLVVNSFMSTNDKSITKLREGNKQLKFAALQCEDDSSMVTYMAYDRGYKSKNATKKHIRTWATVVCDVQTEQVKQVHYHKWAFRIDPNGVDLVRQCLKDHEWELDEDSIESVRTQYLCDGKWTKQYIPLSEFLEHKEEYSIKNGKILN